jgi:hypothetical protein
LHGSVIVLKHGPSKMLPETTALNVCVLDKRITFLDAFFCENQKALLGQCSGNSVASELLFHHKVTENTSSALMTAEYGPNNLISYTRNETQTPISVEIDRYSLPGVRLLQTYPLSLFPKSVHFIVIINRHLANDVIHFRHLIKNVPIPSYPQFYLTGALMGFPGVTLVWS